MTPRVPVALKNAQHATDKLWRRYVEVVDFDYPLAQEIVKAARELQQLAHLLYASWQIRGGQSNDGGNYSLPVEHDAIDAALNRHDWDSVEYTQKVG